MRILVFFDLPVDTSAQRKAYRRFRKFLISDGYIMMQESVYSKLLINQASMNSAILRLKRSKPAQGLVQVLKVTEKQFAAIEFLTGTHNTEKIETTDRLVIL